MTTAPRPHDASAPRPRVVVLGGTGFLGRHLATAFRATGADVVSLARTPPRDARPHDTGAEASRFVAADLLDSGPDRLRELFTTLAPDIVVNAAGAVWRVSPDRMRRTNADLVTDLVAALRDLPAPPLLIQLGSIHEYGLTGTGAGFTEQDTPAPVNDYGRAKLRATRTVLDAARGGALDGVVLRLANVVGPDAPAGSLLGDIAAHLERYAHDPAGVGPELLVNPLRAERDFVDVTDVAAAVLAVARAERADVRGRVLNIGSGRAVRAGLLVERLVELSGLPVRLVERDGAAATRSDADRQLMDLSLAGALLGWQPRVHLDESLLSLLKTT
ncbi:NAD(P)-dependent oxidoreductase [Streptomyces sp. RerS4]|uniref:NAD-dependent epimerase/dehydratase family protein n=1 Tax=Streptomyces sp. RerS4 TaxID=2942449 RepID=UPI00201C7757|nr:NAD(P)-dependent oxidoreductase [Streptomyces sp. RerS4]UQX05462.1 NAD(P)-dependent oxidoreductase [Streptomyces sp. RerS4]